MKLFNFPYQSTEGGTRTHTSVKTEDFKSAVSTIPPPRPKMCRPLRVGFLLSRTMAGMLEGLEIFDRC